jgi:hypothetical protein
MSSHTSLEVRTCIDIALRCVKIDPVKRPNIAEIINELYKVNTSQEIPISQVNTVTPLTYIHALLILLFTSNVTFCLLPAICTIPRHISVYMTQVAELAYCLRNAQETPIIINVCSFRIFKIKSSKR